ncbi:MAG: S-layer homology domain-containing protein [Solibacillus sp.]
MTKKAFKIFTAATVAASVVVPVASASAAFKDVSVSNSHYEAIHSLAERGIINGYEDGTYRPNETLTRGQAAKILANVLELDTTTKDQTFKDVAKTSIYSGAIHALVNAGVINGFEDGTFRPNAPLTRGQMAKIIVKAFELVESTELTHSFKDVTAANGYKYAIQTLLDYNITQGTSQFTYAPAEAVKRGQMASFVVRAEQVVANEVEVSEMDLTVEAVKGTTLVTADGIFEIDSSLQNILSEQNNEALANAELKAKIEQGSITGIRMLEIHASGTLDKPVVLDGKMSSLDGSISVLGNAVEIKNVKVAKDIHVSGQQQNFVKLNGVTVAGKFNVTEAQNKVASLTPVANTSQAASYLFENSQVASVIIARDLVTISANAASDVSYVAVNGNASTVTFNGVFGQVTMDTTGETKLTGDAVITKLVVNSPNVIIDVKGTISTLDVSNADIKLKLNPNVKIKDIMLPVGVDIATIIENYNEVRGNIESINGSAPTSGNVYYDNSTGDSSGGSNNGNNGSGTLPEKPTPPTTPPTTPGGQDPDAGDDQLAEPKPELPVQGELITAKITEILTTEDSSTITTADMVFVRLEDGQIYSVAAEFSDFFKYNKALEGANISVIVKEGRIEAITGLEIIENSATLLDGGGDVIIYGTLKVSKNIQSLMNITVTENVILAADATGELNLNKTKVFGKVEFETAAAFAKRSKLAGVVPLAATTRIKITFTDSTVAIIEIAKEDVELYAGGTTEVANIRLFSNTVLGADLDDGKILPKIVIGQGVTNVILNASIANVIIESDENIVLGGEGNFDEVVINTSKEVALNTVGTIGNLNIKHGAPDVVLGEEIKTIGKVTTDLPVTEIFQNYEEIKDKVGQIVLPDVEFFAAELVTVAEKFGYYTIKLAEVGSHSVKYKLFDAKDFWNSPEIERNKTKAPEDAILYKTGDKIAIPANKYMVIYLVDSVGTIKDYKKELKYGDSIRFTSTTAGVKIETTFEVTEGSKVSDVYSGIFKFSVGDPIVFLGANTIDAYTWTKEDNLGVFYVKSTEIFTAAEGEKLSYFQFDGNVRKIQGSGYHTRFGGSSKENAIKALKNMYALSANDPAPAEMLSGAINLAFYALLINRDNVADRSNGEQYRTAVENATSLENLYDLIVEVNKGKQ